MPATVADPNRSLDSEQISPATIAHHTVYEKIPNLHQSHTCQWGAQPYLVGPLSRLVGKPPFSPWLSRNILPLKRAANGPNSAISLTQTSDRISFCVYNSLYFGVQKAKNGDRGTIVFTATLMARLVVFDIRISCRYVSRETEISATYSTYLKFEKQVFLQSLAVASIVSTLCTMVDRGPRQGVRV